MTHTQATILIIFVGIIAACYLVGASSPPMSGTVYSGPATVVFTDEELLIIWSCLTRNANTENGEIRRRIQAYLETKA